jgi:hypothetical protein
MYALFTSDMLGRVPQGLVSSAGGLTAAAQSVALSVASPLIGRSARQTGSYELAMIAVAVWVLPGALAWLLWKPPPPARE